MEVSRAFHSPDPAALSANVPAVFSDLKPTDTLRSSGR